MMDNNGWVQISNNGKTLTYAKGDAILRVEMPTLFNSNIESVDGLYTFFDKICLDETPLSITLTYEDSGRVISIRPENSRNSIRFIGKLLNKQGYDKPIPICIYFEEPPFPEWTLARHLTATFWAKWSGISSNMMIETVTAYNAPDILLDDRTELSLLENKLKRTWNKYFNDKSFFLDFNGLWNDIHRELVSGTKYPVILYSDKAEYNGWRAHKILFNGGYTVVELVKDRLLMVLVFSGFNDDWYSLLVSAKNSKDTQERFLKEMVEQKQIGKVILYVNDDFEYYFSEYQDNAEQFFDMIVRKKETKNPVPVIFHIQHPEKVGANLDKPNPQGTCFFDSDGSISGIRIDNHEGLASAFEQCFDAKTFKLDSDLFHELTKLF